jgi:hypothetical protein
MTASQRTIASLLCLLAASCLLARTALAQDSSQDSNPSLGDVVRRQANGQHKKAKRVLSDEDVAGPHKHEVTGYAATTVIIPDIRITGTVPDAVRMNVPTDLKQKMTVSFGPSLDSCFDVECAKSTYLRIFPQVFGGTPTVLFETDESIDGNRAQIVHLQFLHNVRGKVLATVALIQTPASAASATCMYKATDAEVETDCDAFIASLRIHVPERYIYVQHPRY